MSTPVTIHVPSTGEFLVRNGVVYPILEVDSRDHNEEYWEYAVYVPVDDEGDEVVL